MLEGWNIVNNPLLQSFMMLSSTVWKTATLDIVYSLSENDEKNHLMTIFVFYIYWSLYSTDYFSHHAQSSSIQKLD